MARYVFTFIRSFFHHWRARPEAKRPPVQRPAVQYTRKSTGSVRAAWTTPDWSRRGWGVSPPFTFWFWAIVFVVLLIAFL